MKLGAPKFILPFFFITQPEILSFSSAAFMPFIIASVGFIALSAGIQSGWGWWQQTLMILLSAAILIFPKSTFVWIPIIAVLIFIPMIWRQHSKAIGPVVSN
jgi:TRAP-type uncharacterized transport system fused permease subunit